MVNVDRHFHPIAIIAIANITSIIGSLNVAAEKADKKGKFLGTLEILSKS